MKIRTDAKVKRQIQSQAPRKTEPERAAGGVRVRTGLKAGNVLKSRHDTLKS